MKYHAKIEYGDDAHYWWNYEKEKIISSLIIPFVNGQVVLVRAKGFKQLLNMRSVTALTIYRTDLKLTRPALGEVPNEFRDQEFNNNACTEEILNEVKTSLSSASSSSLLQKAFATPKPQVFVIMKFGDVQLDSAYEGVIKPIIEENGLRALRVDEIQDAGRITDQILENIAASKYVFAELTGERPNCYYECGFAHALGKELILSIRTPHQIHFDLAGYRFIQWETESDLRRKLRERFASMTSAEQSQ